MTRHHNLTQALCVLGLSVSMTVAQTPANPDKPTSQDRQTSQSGNQTTDQNQKARTAPGTPAAGAQSGADLMVGPADQKFITETAQSGHMEVQLAQLAQQKASSDEVKQYAKQLETDHKKANEELKALATQKNVSVPTEMTPKQQQSVSKLENAAAEKFDREYVKMMVDNHKKSIKNFQKQSERAMDSHVKEFAAKTLPTLQEHLQKAESLQTSTRSRKADDQPATRTDQPRTDQPATRADQPDRKSSDPSGTTDSTQKPQGQGNPTPQK